MEVQGKCAGNLYERKCSQGNVHKCILVHISKSGAITVISNAAAHYYGLSGSLQQVNYTSNKQKIKKNIQIIHINAISYAKLFLPSDFLQ